MELAVNDRVRALKNSEPVQDFDGYFFRAGDTGKVLATNIDGVWVSWDDSDRSDGIWFAPYHKLEMIDA